MARTMDLDSRPASPPARRLATPRWLDGRLAAGIALVLLAVVVGARVFASADHYTRVYVAAHALTPGERLTDGDLRIGQVRFDGQGSGYIAAGSSAPVGYVVTRYVGSGELVPRAALTSSTVVTQATRLVTVPVAAGHVPAGLGHGDLVDVYLTPKAAAGGSVTAPTEVLTAVPVDSTDGGDRSLTGSDTVSVVLAVPVAHVAATIHAVESGSIDLVRVPPGASVDVSPAASPSAAASISGNSSSP